MIRILIADDHPVVRAGLRALFAGEPDIEVLGEAATAEAAVEECRTGIIDLVLLDLQFGDRGLQGVEATRMLRSLEPAPQVLILTTYDSDADILGAIEAGASGYLLKDAPPTELVAALRTAATGASVLAPAVASRLVGRAIPAPTSLSSREIEVLQLVAEGRSNREIGRRLFLSEATVKSHLVHIFTKLGVSSRTHAVAAARKAGTLR
jgi:DNA-binding NarL/FixJ family response regulator